MQNDTKLVDRINFLIKHHDDTIKEIEIFKDKELERLVAADSLAWFTTTGPTIYFAEGEKRAKNINRLKNKALRELRIT